MKRGNTALKRVVSVASVAGMALALAVVAAPAASAATDDPPTLSAVTIRATPIADAAYLTNDGVKVASKISDARRYGEGQASTGQVPTVAAASGQLVSGFQILAALHTDALFTKDSTIQYALPSGINFSRAPIVTMTPKPVDLNDLYQVANASDATVLPAAANETITALPSGIVTASVNDNVLTLKFNGNDPNTSDKVDAGEGGLAGYVITVNNVRVDVTSDYAAAAGNDPITITNIVPVGEGTTPGSTTVGYVSAFKVSADGSYPSGSKDVELPAISVTELVKAGFGTSFELTVSADKAGSDSIAVDATDAKVTASTSVDVSDATVELDEEDASTVVVSGLAAKDTSIERVTLTGLTVSGVKAGSDVTVTLTPTGTADDASSISFTANQATSAAPHAVVSAATIVPRIGADDRYATAANIATAFAKTDAFKKSAVVLANGTTAKDGADALSANFLAYAKGAPILLTDGTTLSSTTKDALTSLFKDAQTNVTIYVMGKTDSVSQAVVDAAKAAIVATVDTATVSTERVAGDNRYDTAAASATTAGNSALGAYNLGNGIGYTAFLASGEVNADALAAGAISAKAGVPVLLTTDGEELPASASKFITDSDVTNVVILGAVDRVSQKVEDALKAAGVNVTRVAGADRYDTAVQVNKLAYDKFASALTLSNATAYLANGQSGAESGFADALAVGPLAGANENPLLTVPQSTLPATTQGWLSTNKANIDGIVALGKSDRIADSVVTAAQAAIK